MQILRRPLPLSWLLLGPALFILVATVTAVGFIAFQSARGAVQRFERQLAQEIGRGMEAELLQLTRSVAEVVSATGDAARRGWMRTSRQDELLQYTVNQLRHHPNLGFLAVGLPDGEVQGALRDPEEGTLRGVRRDQARLALYFLSTADDLPTERAVLGPPFDVRERASYRRAAESLRAGWSPVSRYASNDTLGIGMSAPLLAADGSGLLGVVTAEISLIELSRFLAERFGNRAGLAFVAETDGQLLGVSLPEPLAQPANGRLLSQRHFRDMRDPRLRAMLGWLPVGLKAEQSFVRLDGVRYLLDLRKLQAPGGLELLLGVLIEESELQGSMWSQARGAALSVALIALLGLGLLALLLRLVQQRVEAVSTAAQRLADGDRSARAPERMPARELQTLASSFNRMSHQLEAVVSGLEAEVEARTHALAEANAELQRQVRLDGLTQIANRRHFDEQLELAWRRCLRAQRPLALVLLDVDDFKAYNDHYGHPAGDEVLRQVARVLAQQQRRADDLAARYGGEEFVLLLPDADGVAAEGAAERLLEALRALALPHEKARAAPIVTASLGVAAGVPQRGHSSAEWLAAADAALYAAKQQGRNRVHLAPSHDEK